MGGSDIELAVNAALAERGDAEPLAFRSRAGVVLILGTAGEAEWGAVVVVRDDAVRSLSHFDSHDDAVAAAARY